MGRVARVRERDHRRDRRGERDDVGRRGCIAGLVQRADRHAMRHAGIERVDKEPLRRPGRGRRDVDGRVGQVAEVARVQWAGRHAHLVEAGVADAAVVTRRGELELRAVRADPRCREVRNGVRRDGVGDRQRPVGVQPSRHPVALRHGGRMVGPGHDAVLQLERRKRWILSEKQASDARGQGRREGRPAREAIPPAKNRNVHIERRRGDAHRRRPVVVNPAVHPG